MATDIERLMVRLEANATSFEKALKRAEGVANKSTRNIERSVERSNQRIQSLMNSTAQSVSTGYSRIAAMAGAYLSTDALRKYADAWQSAVNKIAAAQGTRQGADNRASQLTDIAIASNSDLGAVADLYSGLTRSTKELGASQAQVLAVTETISKAFAVGGQSASTQAGAITQLNQALQTGKLSGDEFNSVNEGAPLIMDAVAKKLGVARGELKKLAADGKITSTVLIEALLEYRGAIESQFATMVPTIEQSLNKLSAALTRYFGQLATQYDISGKVAAATQFVVSNLDTIVQASAVLGVALAAAFAPLIGGPVAAGIAAAGAAFALFGDEIRPIAGEIATIADYARAAFELIRTEGGTVWQEFSRQIGEVATNISSVLSTMSGSFQTFAGDVKNMINSIIGAFDLAATAIEQGWAGAASAIASSMINAMNAVIDAVNNAVQFISAKLNSLGSAVGLTINAVGISRIENSYKAAGEKAAQAYSDAYKRATTNDYVGDAFNRFSDGAKQLADQRAELQREANRARALGAGDGSLTQKLNAPKAEGGGGKGGGGSGSGKDNEFEKEQQNLEKRIATLNREREALSLSAFEAAKAEASQKLLDAAKKAGIPVTDELRAKIDEQSAAYARAKVALDEAKASQQAFKELQQFVGSSLSGFFSDIVSGGKNASEALMNLTKKLADAALQAALLGEGPLAALFGSKGSGGIIGMLFKGFSGSFGGFGGGLSGTGGLYASGGYTGAGGKNEAAGIVHRGEYVMSADAVKRLGLGNLEALHRIGKRGFAAGGYVGALPSLAPSLARAAPQASPTINISIPGAATDAQIRALVAQGVKAGMERTTRQIGRNAHSMFRNADMRYA